MATTVKALAFVFVYFAFSVQPATAAPNVFWTFGFDRHYALAAGGRADLPARVMLAAKQPTTPYSATNDAVQETLPPVMSKQGLVRPTSHVG